MIVRRSCAPRALLVFIDLSDFLDCRPIIYQKSIVAREKLIENLQFVFNYPQYNTGAKIDDVSLKKIVMEDINFSRFDSTHIAYNYI